MELRQVEQVLSRSSGQSQLSSGLVQNIGHEDEEGIEQVLGLSGRVLHDVSRHIPSRLLDIARHIFLILQIIPDLLDDDDYLFT